MLANGENAIVLTDRMTDNHLATNWKAKPAEWTNSISDIIANVRRHGQAYDLLGRRVHTNPERGIIIVDGKKIIKQ